MPNNEERFMISHEIYCEIQTCRNQGLSQRKAADKLGLNRETIRRYWDMTEADFEANESIRNKLYPMQKEIKALAVLHSYEETSKIIYKKYGIKTSARTLNRLLREWESDSAKEQQEVFLYCGDCRDVLLHIADESIDLVVTDAPYKIVSGGISKNQKKNEVSGIFNKRTLSENADLVQRGKIFL